MLPCSSIALGMVPVRLVVGLSDMVMCMMFRLLMFVQKGCDLGNVLQTIGIL
jgi:hypothetical protein